MKSLSFTDVTRVLYYNRFNVDLTLLHISSIHKSDSNIGLLLERIIYSIFPCSEKRRVEYISELQREAKVRGRGNKRSSLNSGSALHPGHSELRIRR